MVGVFLWAAGRNGRCDLANVEVVWSRLWFLRRACRAEVDQSWAGIQDPLPVIGFLLLSVSLESMTYLPRP